ncbi:MAG: hypothetical protein AAF597_09535, partial [Bacteroidota bacterium]
IGAKDYSILFGGDVPSAANRSYRLTNFLARYHDVHLSQTEAQPAALLIRHGGQEVPAGMEVLFNEDGLLVLVKE